MGFETDFEQKVKETIRKHKLLSRKDRIMVACSGGKDSMTILYLLHKWGYDVKAFAIDLGIGTWSDKNIANITKFCRDTGIVLHTVRIKDELGLDIRDVHARSRKDQELNTCTICSIFKRWILNRQARERGCTRIVTGHNTDDEAETVMMNMFRSTLSLAAAMGPMPGVERNRKFVLKVKPLYYCLNSEIIRYSKLKRFPVVYSPCPCSTDVLRRNVRNMLTALEKKNPKIKANIVRSFLKIQPAIKERYGPRKKGGIKYCSRCGEPTVEDVCQTCKLLKMVGHA